MPAKLEKIIHDDIPFLWDKIKEQYDRFMEYGVEKLGLNSAYILVGIGVLLLCFIIGIAVHKANKRDRSYLESMGDENPIEKAIAVCDYEAIVNGNKKAASYTIEEEESDKDIDWLKTEEATLEEEKKSEPTNPVTINMEKIEIVRQEAEQKTSYGIKYNVSRTGKVYTEEELVELIKE